MFVPVFLFILLHDCMLLTNNNMWVWTNQSAPDGINLLCFMITSLINSVFMYFIVILASVVTRIFIYASRSYSHVFIPATPAEECPVWN